LFASIASGLAFQATLKQQVQEWSKNRSTRTLAQMHGVQLQLPFAGMAVGICVFLAAGLETFGFPAKLSYAIALPLTALTTILVWSQLSQLLVQLERGGSRSIDLDALE
jgi:formate hydrogenlyase subunit 3/multisubunit Na+/H+ antiporter MnhD subunit